MLIVLGVSSPLPRSNSLIFLRFLSRLLGISSYSTLPSALFPFGIQFVDHHAPFCFLPRSTFCLPSAFTPHLTSRSPTSLPRKPPSPDLCSHSCLYTFPSSYEARQALTMTPPSQEA